MTTHHQTMISSNSKKYSLVIKHRTTITSMPLVQKLMLLRYTMMTQTMEALASNKKVDLTWGLICLSMMTKEAMMIAMMAMKKSIPRMLSKLMRILVLA